VKNWNQTYLNRNETNDFTVLDTFLSKDGQVRLSHSEDRKTLESKFKVVAYNGEAAIQ
jgi:hypothetical protein